MSVCKGLKSQPCSRMPALLVPSQATLYQWRALTMRWLACSPRFFRSHTCNTQQSLGCRCWASFPVRDTVSLFLLKLHEYFVLYQLHESASCVASPLMFRCTMLLLTDTTISCHSKSHGRCCNGWFSDVELSGFCHTSLFTDHCKHSGLLSNVVCRGYCPA